MKVAILQTAPKLGEVQQNIAQADYLLSGLTPGSVKWLVLPEMAFSGYNFPSTEAISPYLEPTAAGVSTQWATTTAKRLRCHVTVGYPETTVTEPKRHYNSTVTVGPTGNMVAHYRKTFLYYTDETWANEGTGFYHDDLYELGDVCMGICMDINPKQFQAPWDAYEFAHHALSSGAPLVVLSMAWLTRLTPQELEELPYQPDMETLAYWVERFYPFLGTAGGRPVTLVIANRCGQEGEACYAGSSTVISIREGKAAVYEICGKMEQRCLVVDLAQAPKLAIQHGGAA
ncbi:carbon-nitrogen hydrolase [Eremomyces bilateralis CBS 781.70]|uniref:Carbon-nitrogen hydrolase n=1 Tax=Eremomyces bilateralis CBS 781.70 TaxID=1392243 RepID=A0A6G1G2I6_9PEZI|nr:carbon-nitrogen hydrolase [Eremomyces bilateralis CBS 781.70]KAF1812019.1 carbon-nitrogen hydrolase [Eremomyces bilateralis CBS 781.70]